MKGLVERVLEDMTPEERAEMGTELALVSKRFNEELQKVFGK